MNGKKIVVTGGAGFVGTHLVELLLGEGAEVVVLDNFSRGINYVEGAKYHRVDVGHTAPCKTHFRDAWGVLNLAAEVAGVIHNQSHHAEMYYKNMRVQSAPVAAAAAVGIQRFVQVSSVCIYGEKHNHPAIDEFEYNEIGTPVKANEGYSWSKRMGERIAAWSGIETVSIVRPSNVYGPGDYFDERAHVIPALIKKVDEDDEIVLHGSGKEIREFIYVTDVARGMMAALNAPPGVNVYNLGTNSMTATTILGLAKSIAHIMEVDKKIKTTPEKDGGDNTRFSRAEKAKKELGWEYQVGLSDGLEKTVEWYLK